MGVQVNASPSAAKLRGGYYTPEAVSLWLAQQVAPAAPTRILEPSAGDGALLSALMPRLSKHALIDAVEYNAAEAQKLRQLSIHPGLRTHNGDVFAWFAAASKRRGYYDLVLGNPPYIRYQHWPREQSELAFALMRGEGLRPSRLTNAWLPFVVLGTVALRPGGQLALVLPAELLQVGYAGELRRYLSDKYEDILLVTFEELVFPGILQETVLLLARKRSSGTGTARIRTVEVRNGAALGSAQLALRESDVALLDHSTEKWTKYLLTAREVDFLREAALHPSLVRFGAIAEVDVGIVTGRNKVFVLTPTAARAAGIEEYCVPLVGRSAHVPGVMLRRQDWRRLYDEDARVLLLNLPGVPAEDLMPAAQYYIAQAEYAGQHTGYKCRIRMPQWWRLPATWAPDAFLLRQIYDGPRLVLNGAAATCTDTLHKVRFREGTAAELVAVNAHNSITWALSEVRGRSYGGGVLELEPSEAEALLLPAATQPTIDLIDLEDIIRRKGNAAGVDEVNTRVLVEQCGWSREEVALARGIAAKLAGRRLGRRALKEPAAA